MRCAPNKLVFNTLEAYQDIYHNDRLVKARDYMVTSIVGHYSVFTALDKKLHSHKRRIIGKAVSEKSMREFEPIMMQHIDALIEQLETSSQQEESINMTTYCKRFGFDVVSDLAFGESLNLLANPKYRWIIRWMEMFEVRNNTNLQAPTIWWSGLDIPLFVLKVVRGNRFVKMIRGLTDRRLERGKNSREDFFAFMLSSKDPFTGKDATMREFLEEALFFFPAGMCTICSQKRYRLIWRNRW